MQTIRVFLMLSACLMATKTFAADSRYISGKVDAGIFKTLTQVLVPVKVMKVIDPLTFIGEDRKIYQLAGLEIPNLQTGNVDFTTDAVKTLALLIEGKELKIYITKNDGPGRLNRMNQQIVQAELKQDHVWVEGELLEAGIARVRTTQSNPEMAAAMLAAEDTARKGKRGIWADDRANIRTPENISSHMNSFEVVEGTPKAAAMTRNMVFLNYGDDYKTDFTVGIPSNLKIAFSKRGVDPLKLAHAKIRVRGWVQSYNGPFIEIDHPEQIEILSDHLSAFAPSNTPMETAPTAGGMRTISMPVKPQVNEPAAPAPPKPVVDKKKDAAEFNP